MRNFLRQLLTNIAREHALPFETLIPNAETVEVMKEARRGKLASFNSVDALLADLNADDRVRPGGIEEGDG